MADGEILDIASHVDQFYCDPSFLSVPNNPGILFTNAKFDGSNFLSWSQSIKLALGTKAKLKFIDGIHSKSNSNSIEEQSWNRCDSMVRRWTLNSMSKELVDGFLCARLAGELLNDICGKFGLLNGPLLCQL